MSDSSARPETLSIAVGGTVFTARLEWELAPQSCAAFLAQTPFQNKLIHSRWSGEACWIPLGDLEFGVDFRRVYAGVLRDWLKQKPEQIIGRQAPLRLIARFRPHTKSASTGPRWSTTRCAASRRSSSSSEAKKWSRSKRRNAKAITARLVTVRS